VTPSPSRSRRARRRGVARRLVVAVAAAVAALAVLAPALVAPGTPAAAQPARVQVSLVDHPYWVRPGERFDVRLRAPGAPADAAVQLVVHDPVDSRREFRDTLDGDLGDVAYTGERAPLAGLPAGPGGSVTTGFVAGPGGAPLPGRGVYPVEVQLVSAGGEVLGGFVTYLVYLRGPRDQFPPLSAAVVLDVAADPSLQPDGTVVPPDGAVDRARERADVFGAVTGVPVTLAPRPETLAALGQAGPAGRATVDDLRAAAATRPVLARPFVDIDLADLRRAGLVGEANAQAEGGANVVRSELGTEPIGGVWLSGPTLGAESARLARDLGFAKALVPPSAVDGGGDDEPVPLGPVRLGDDGPVAMVSDPDLAAHLTGDADMVGAHRFVAELAITWLEAPSNPRAVAVHIPADADIDPATVASAVGALGDGQAVRVLPLDQLLDAVPPPEDGVPSVSLAPDENTDDLRAVAGPLQAARATVAGLGGLVDEPELAASMQESLLLSTGADTPDADRAAYVDRVTAALGTVTGAVTLPDQFRITLTSRSSSIPVTLTNLSDRELSVQVHLDSDQLEFPDGDVIPARLVPGTTRLDVPVRARTSGAFTLDVRVTSPDGSIELDRSTFDIRSTAISGVGLFLSVGAGLFLLVWWARHWRSARRSRHLMPAAAVPTEPVPGGDAAGSPAATAATAARPVAGHRPESADDDYRPAHMAAGGRGGSARRP
jgi:hypothetical protein